MYAVDLTIIGAGLVGLALARELSGNGRTVVVVEQEPGPGRGISSRNSEVIHAGIYYPPGSLKARLCVEGRQLLYAFYAEHNIPHQHTGKVIVATNQAEEPSLEELCARGHANGIPELRLLDTSGLQAREPNVKARGALLSPDSGILDVHRLVKRLEALALDRAAIILYNTRLQALEKAPPGFRLTVEGTERYTFSSRMVINAAGLGAAHVARLAGIDPVPAGYVTHLVKGEYFRVRPSKVGLVHGLVYPSPLAHLTGLGIHATKDLSGALRLGPNACYNADKNYDVDPSHARAFYESTRSFLPFITPDDLSPDMAGIRPKLQAPGEAVRDFVIKHETACGLAGLINLVGIESPGLTACLAIARRINDMLQEAGL